MDIKIAYTGLRPGEKIYEELFYSNENIRSSEHEKIMRVEAPVIDTEGVKQQWSTLKHAYADNDESLKKYLFSLAHSCDINAAATTYA